MGKPRSSSPLTNLSDTTEEQSIDTDAKKSYSDICVHPSFHLLPRDERGIVILKDNTDKIKFLHNIQAEIDRRKLMRSESIHLTHDIVMKQKKSPQHCPTFRVPHKEVEEEDELFRFNHTNKQHDLIGYDIDCDESLMDFLGSSSREYGDSLVWERTVPRREVGDTLLDESEEDPEILDYINSQKWKRDHGQNVTGETFYQDKTTGRLRNLHKDSVSITLYNTDSDYGDDFGKASIFRPIMTIKEKLSKLQ